MGYLTDAGLDSGAYNRRLEAAYTRTGGLVDRIGAGSPEGAVAAPVGSTFTQTDSLTALGGILVWRKRSGTGTTGWAVVEGETPWYPLTTSGTQSGTLHIRRRGGLVSLRFTNLILSAGTGRVQLVAANTPGFAPPTYLTSNTCVRDFNQTITQAIFVSPISLIAVFWEGESAQGGAWSTTHPTGPNDGITGLIEFSTDTTWPTVAPA